MPFLCETLHIASTDCLRARFLVSSLNFGSELRYRLMSLDEEGGGTNVLIDKLEKVERAERGFDLSVLNTEYEEGKEGIADSKRGEQGLSRN